MAEEPPVPRPDPEEASRFEERVRTHYERGEGRHAEEEEKRRLKELVKALCDNPDAGAEAWFEDTATDGRLWSGCEEYYWRWAALDLLSGRELAPNMRSFVGLTLFELLRGGIGVPRLKAPPRGRPPDRASWRRARFACLLLHYGLGYNQAVEEAADKLQCDERTIRRDLAKWRREQEDLLQLCPPEPVPEGGSPVEHALEILESR